MMLMADYCRLPLYAMLTLFRHDDMPLFFRLLSLHFSFAVIAAAYAEIRHFHARHFR